jgi:hypothetical protein
VDPSDDAGQGTPLTEVLNAFRVSMSRTAEAVQTASQDATRTEVTEYAISGFEVEIFARVLGAEEEVRVAFDGEPNRFSRMRFGVEPLALDVTPPTPTVTLSWTLEGQELVARALLQTVTGVSLHGQRVEWYSDAALDTGSLASATTDTSGLAVARIRVALLGRNGLSKLTVSLPDLSITVDQQLLVVSAST